MCQVAHGSWEGVLYSKHFIPSPAVFTGDGRMLPQGQFELKFWVTGLELPISVL